MVSIGINTSEAPAAGVLPPPSPPHVPPTFPGATAPPTPHPSPLLPTRDSSALSHAETTAAEKERAEGCSLVREMDGPLEAPCVILVPNAQSLREGSQLVGPVVVGRQLGSGAQARVHELTLADGTPTGKVIKIAHTDIGHKALNMIWIGMEREWEVGLKLRVALQDAEGHLPGFMRICDALVSKVPGGGAAPGRRRARFAGMVLEKLNGWEVYKRIYSKEFHNIHYVKAMSRQVFTALDRAERETGFFHADLGQRNVMEHYPELYDEPAAAEAARRESGSLEAQPMGEAEGPRYETLPGALPGSGGGGGGGGISTGSSPTAPLPTAPLPGAAAPGTSGRRVDVQRVPIASSELNIPANINGGSSTAVEVSESSSSESSRGATPEPPLLPPRVRPRPGYTCNSDGSRMPLGPRVEFKIIDYGSSFFSVELAQATGGFRARRNYERLRRLFEAGKVAFKSATRESTIEVDTAGGKPAGERVGDGHSRRWHLLPTSLRQRFTLKSAPEGALPVPAPLTSPLEEEPSGALPERFQSFTAGPISRTSTPPARPPAVTAPPLGALPDGSGPSQTPLTPPTPPVNIIEKMYRGFWRRKMDVYHLLLGLAVALDDRVWPTEDREDVQLFISLMHHVTGVRLRASFASEGEPAAAGQPRAIAQAPSTGPHKLTKPQRGSKAAAQARERTLTPTQAPSAAATAPAPSATLEGLSQRDAAVLLAITTTGSALLAGDLILWHNLSSLDAGVHTAVRAYAAPELLQWARSTLSNAPIVAGWAVWAAAAVTLAAAAARGATTSEKVSRAVRHMAIAAAGYLIGGGSIQHGDPYLVNVLKNIFQRERPTILSTYSFPSGHSTAGAFMGGVLLFVVIPAVVEVVGVEERVAAAVRRVRPVLWAACAVATASGRVLADVHWTTDVAAGACLGTGLVAATALACSAVDAAVEQQRRR